MQVHYLVQQSPDSPDVTLAAGGNERPEWGRCTRWPHELVVTFLVNRPQCCTWIGRLFCTTILYYYSVLFFFKWLFYEDLFICVLYSSTDPFLSMTFSIFSYASHLGKDWLRPCFYRVVYFPKSSQFSRKLAPS